MTLKANTHLLGSPEDTKSHLPTLTGSWPALSSAPVNTSLYSLGNNLAASAAATSPGPVDTLTLSPGPRPHHPGHHHHGLLLGGGGGGG